VSLKEEKERAVTYQEPRHAEGTPPGKAQAPAGRKGLQGGEGGMERDRERLDTLAYTYKYKRAHRAHRGGENEGAATGRQTTGDR